jgi:hypothetical protein
MDAGKPLPSFSSNGERIFKNVVVEREDELASHIKYRFKLRNYCFRCNKPFSSFSDLRTHKREVHSY